MTDSARSLLKDWVVPVLASVLTAATLYGWAFEAQFTKEVGKRIPEMRREVHEIVESKATEIERDRLNELRRIDERLTRIETLLEQIKEER